MLVKGGPGGSLKYVCESHLFVYCAFVRLNFTNAIKVIIKQMSKMYHMDPQQYKAMEIQAHILGMYFT